jgi:hypothetical protein
MFDELQLLRDSEPLRRLLAHYAVLGTVNREVWQDRLMQMAGVEAKALTKLHGELVAFAWIEQNTGVTPISKPGVLAGWYRITGPGQRALKRAQTAPESDDEEAMAA